MNLCCYHQRLLEAWYSIVYTYVELCVVGERGLVDQHGPAGLVLQKAESIYDQHAQQFSNLELVAHVAIQNPTSKVWNIYGTVMQTVNTVVISFTHSLAEY